ncbi:hypothetical protein [Micromonospora avicenniae]|uniref:hypothetical protein n=1 Tax=Micromonospora avicenniae TaxID=1198245 RepID=UPI00331E7C06
MRSALSRVNAILMSMVCVTVGALLGACSSPPSVPIVVDDMAGRWCSDEGDSLSLAESGDFTLDNLSPAFFTLFDLDEGYLEEFIIKRDFGGEVPTAGRGTWEFGPDSNSPGLWLNFQSLGLSKEVWSVELLARRDDQGRAGLYGYEIDPDLGYTVRFLKCG